MTYPERSAEAAQMAADLSNALSAGGSWAAADVKKYTSLNAFAGYIDETLAFRKLVDEVARLAMSHCPLPELRSIMLPDPVDPDVLLARKVAADAVRWSNRLLAENIMAGKEDALFAVTVVLAGIKAAREADNG